MQGSTGQGLALQLTMVSFHDNGFCLRCEASAMWEKPFTEFLFLFLCAWTAVNAESKRARTLEGSAPKETSVPFLPDEALDHQEASLSLGGGGTGTKQHLLGRAAGLMQSQQACLPAQGQAGQVWRGKRAQEPPSLTGDGQVVVCRGSKSQSSLAPWLLVAPPCCRERPQT